MDVSLDQIVENGRNKFLVDSQVQRILAELEFFRWSAPRGAEARIGCLFGPPGVGKTTIIRKLRSQHQSFVKDGVRQHPIPYVKTPGTPNLKATLIECLKSIGAGAHSRDTVPDMVRRLKHYVKECGVQLIVLDEFQHFLDIRGTSRSGLADTIKSILNECRCPILAVGVETAPYVIAMDSQLRSRCIYRREMHLFQPSQSGGKPNDGSFEGRGPSYDEFRNVIYQLVATYGFDNPSSLAENDAAQILYKATGGEFRQLADIVCLSAEKARIEKRQNLTIATVLEIIEFIGKPLKSKEKTKLEELLDTASTATENPKRGRNASVIAGLQQGFRDRGGAPI